MLAFFRNRIVLASLLLIVLVVVGRATWTRLGYLVVKDPRFAFSPDKFAINEPPEWIQSDVKEAALRVGDLEEASLLDRDLVPRIEDALRLQTWVAEVRQVRKSANGVRVDVAYREPVGMVEIVTQGRPKLQPVDQFGVLLPGAEFSQTQAGQFLRIAVPHPKLNGLIDGTEWPDERITAAAGIAGVLNESRKELQLFRVNLLLPERGSRSEVPVFELETRFGHRIIWGSAPAQELAGEGTADERLQAVRSLKGVLKQRPGPGQPYAYDVRTGTAIQLEDTVPESRTEPPASLNPWGLDDA